MRLRYACLIVPFVALALPSSLVAQSIKGQLLWSDKNIPKPAEINPKWLRDAGIPGKLFDESLLIDAKSKGIKNAVFWLVDAKEPLKQIPTPRELADKKVTIVTAGGRFVERVTVALDGQELMVRSSTARSYCIHFNGGKHGPVHAVSVVAKPTSLGRIKGREFPTIPYNCSVHPWMRGWLVVPKSPYYTITDAEGKFEITAPAGNYRLMGWHEKIGWIFPGDKMEKRNVPVTIPKEKTLELKPLLRKVEDDE